MRSAGHVQFKWPSLLQFDEASHGDETIRGNLRRLYWLDEVASDSQMRDILDLVKPSELRQAFRAIHSSAQRGKVLEDFAIFDNRYLLSIDGTGLYSSTKVKCPQCSVKKHRNGEIEYYHQSLAAVIVHPEQKTALPLDFEPILKSDGDKKNDCERNAAKHLLVAINQLYSNRPFVVLEDALAANGPHSQLHIGYGMDFIINVTPEGNASLFEVMHERFLLGQITEDDETLVDGSGRGYRFAATLPLNASHPDTRVNMIEYWEVDKNDPEKVTLNMSWIIDLEITPENIYEIVRAARTRWKVQDETVNTLKNQGYDYEHKYVYGLLLFRKHIVFRRQSTTANVYPVSSMMPFTLASDLDGVFARQLPIGHSGLDHVLTHFVCKDMGTGVDLRVPQRQIAIRWSSVMRPRVW